MTFDFKSYYEKNKEKILAERRERYATDKKYREEAKRRSREYEERTHVSSDPTIIHDKEGREYYTISHVSKAIGKDVTTVRQYHVDGVIPLPTAFNTRGWRLYTFKQLRLLKIMFDRHEDNETIKKELKKRWRKCG